MKIFVKDLKNGDNLTNELFGVEEIQQHKTRKGDPYFRIVLQDRTGDIAGKIWKDDFPNCQTRDLQKGDAVKIDGRVQEYNGALQLIVNKLQIVKEYDLTLLLQSTERDIDKMFETFLKKINSIKNKHLKKLLETIFDDEKLRNKFKSAPAAEMVHHDFVGGLLEHTLEMLEISDPFFNYYPEADRDLVYTGIILHDIGKLWELGIQGSQFYRTTEGRLIGHLHIGLEFMQKKRPKDFPDKLWMLLEHIILSHHTELEFGAVVKPATIEASIVASVDNASTKVRQFQKAMKLGEGRDPGFSEYQKWIGTQVYLGE